MFNESVLVESRSARDSQLANATHEQAEDVMSKAKALLHFAVYQGNKIATTEQMAEFYEIPVDTIRSVVSRHKEEFVSDGLKVLKYKALKEVREILSIHPATSQVTIWTPKAALRLGLLLSSASAVASDLRLSLGLPFQMSLSFKECDIERFAHEAYGGKRQKILGNNKRIDICDGAVVTEIKKGTITARHIGQLFEYLHQSGLREGRLIGVGFAPCSIALIKSLRKSGYLIECVTYDR